RHRWARWRDWAWRVRCEAGLTVIAATPSAASNQDDAGESAPAMSYCADRGAMARILIIDDNETMREGLAATVRRMGHEALVAASGADGLKEFKRRGADFVITDLKMEGTG